MSEPQYLIGYSEEVLMSIEPPEEPPDEEYP